MKYLIILLVFLFSINESFSQAQQEKGKLQQPQNRLIFEMEDGSEIIKYSKDDNFYHLRSNNINPDVQSHVPKFVKVPDKRYILHADDGKLYESFDLHNWIPLAAETTDIIEEQEGTGSLSIKIIKESAMPVSSDVISLDFWIQDASEVTFEVIDLQGRVVKSMTTTMPSGNNNIRLDIKDLTSGSYIYKLSDHKNTITKKFINL